MTKLTKRMVEAAAAPEDGRQVLIWDSEVKGFGLRITPQKTLPGGRKSGGAKSYILNYRTIHGQQKRFTIGTHGSPWTVETARERANKLLREVKDGGDPLERKAEARAALSVAELVDLYLTDGKVEKPNKKQSSWDADSINLRRHVVPLIGHRAVVTLTKKDIERLQTDIAEGATAKREKTKKQGLARVTGGKGSASRTVVVLAAMLQFAVGRGIIKENPAVGVKRFAGEKMERFLSEREVMALGAALAAMEEDGTIGETYAAAIRLLALTGARRTEIFSLEWAWVDWDASCLRLPDSKTGAKVIPLPRAGREVLDGIAREEGARFVFPATRGDGYAVGIQKQWDALKTRATEIAREQAREAGEPIERAPNLLDVRLHDLRHSYASFAVTDGAPLLMIGKVLGHKQARTTEVYSHLSADPVRAMADRTATKIDAAFKAGVRRKTSI